MPDSFCRRPAPTRPNAIAAARNVAAIVTVVILCAIPSGCEPKRPGPPAPTTGEPTAAPAARPLPAHYGEFVGAFEMGLAALDADVPQMAEASLNRAVELVPDEPAAWADRGLLNIRVGRLPEAERDLAEARKRAPNDPAIEKLMGLLKQKQGDFGAAAGHLRKALEKDPGDPRTLFSLARLIDQERAPGSEAEYQRLMEQILGQRPDDLMILSERLRTAARRNDAAAVDDTLKRFDALAPNWEARTQTMLADLKRVLADPKKPSTVAPLLRFTNVLKAERGYARKAAEIQPPDSLLGDPLRAFLTLPASVPQPAAADAALAFARDESAAFPAGAWKTVLPVWLSSEGNPVTFLASDTELRRADQEVSIPSIPAAPGGLVAIDWNNDQRTDLLVAGPQGLRFLQQKEDGTFDNVTAKTGLPEDVLTGHYGAALAADLDLDADLDLLLSRASDSPLQLRNNFDGTFRPDPVFAEANGPQQFAWGDFDADGVPDAALLDAEGRLRVYANDRMSSFRPWPVSAPTDRFLAIAVADANEDGAFDLVALRQDGALLVLADEGKRARWTVAELGRFAGLDPQTAPGAVRLLTGDFDNNGANDLLASGASNSLLWLGEAGKSFKPAAAKLPTNLLAAADLAGTGRLGLLGLNPEGKPQQLQSRGEKNYHWLTLRPQATKADGDNRINSFGIGGSIEIRSGTLVAKQPIQTPTVHFGLGERTQADIARIDWPNGAPQFEFNLKPDTAVVALQRLKGSCPFLYAWNGERFEFVTDFMWSTPLGMYINASNKGGFLQTTDWVRIPGEQLVERDGHYDLRVNANLWETHFFDQVGLFAVDHPEGTEFFVDERFCMEPSQPTFQLVEKRRPVVRAWDHLGQDATKEVRETDGRHLDRAGRGRYQGVTNDHWVEFDLGPVDPADGPVWLIARGWVHPTDSSVNYALEQGEHARPQGLVLEVPDVPAEGRIEDDRPWTGAWKTARDKLGFPAGKNKTVLVRLDGLGANGGPRRLRLRTTMEIYWDSLAVARGLDPAAVKRTDLVPEQVDLRFRGVVAMTQANPGSPELPHYNQLVGIGQPWRDLIGYHTRFGDIQELVRQVDDRYAILTAGDEVVLRYPVPAPPPAGWKRDFVWVSDGWVKDGDFNTRFGKFVLPLPAHDMTTYDTPPTTLEEDPIYRRHPQDWEVFHTRYVTPELFERGLRPSRNPSPSAAQTAAGREP